MKVVQLQQQTIFVVNLSVDYFVNESISSVSKTSKQLIDLRDLVFVSAELKVAVTED